MKLKLLFALLIVTISNAQTQIGQDIVGDNGDPTFGSATALSENGNVLAISSTDYNMNGTPDGLVRVYSKASGNWTQIGQDIIGPTNSKIGYRVVLSNDGSVLAVSNYSNLVQVYKNVNNNWVQIGQDIQEYGHSISLSGDGSTIAIGDGIITNYSPVTIYQNISGTWTEIGQIGGGTPGFGFSVALSENGDTLALSFYDIGGGSVPGDAKIFVYKNVNNTWAQVGNTIVCNPNDGNMGYRISISSDGNTLAVTANNTQSATQNSGSVYVYKNINNTWTQMGNEIVGQVPNERYAQNVAISGSGNVVVVGSMTSTTGKTGRLDIFQYLQGNWVKKGEIIDPNGSSIWWAIALSRDGKNLAFSNLGNVTVNPIPKPAANNIEEQLITDNLSITNNYEAKGGPGSSIMVFDIQGILSSDTFVLENFNIYPNPTTEILNIELDNNLTLEKVLVYDTTGKLVKETTKKTINVSGFAKGMYNVQVVTNQGKATKKVIVK